MLFAWKTGRELFAIFLKILRLSDQRKNMNSKRQPKTPLPHQGTGSLPWELWPMSSPPPAPEYDYWHKAGWHLEAVSPTGKRAARKANVKFPFKKWKPGNHSE